MNNLHKVTQKKAGNATTTIRRRDWTNENRNKGTYVQETNKVIKYAQLNRMTYQMRNYGS